jgi:hypothetical protein
VIAPPPDAGVVIEGNTSGVKGPEPSAADVLVGFQDIICGAGGVPEDELMKTILPVGPLSSVEVTRLSNSNPPPEMTILVAVTSPDRKRFM